VSAARPAVQVGAAYRHCEAVTRAQAANFFYGIRLLPAGRRRAMCAVYAFARRIDDIGDGTLETEEKLRRLDGQARALAALEGDGTRAVGHAGAVGATRAAGEAAEVGLDGAIAGGDPVMVALADAQRWFPLPVGALRELIDGVRMDVTGVTYESFEDLVVYCRRVAGAIGRLCLAIFGLRADLGADLGDAGALADDLGVALQLTNILRDVHEDAELGRVYLPAAELRQFGLAGEDLLGATRSTPSLVADADAERLARLSALVRFEAERAREWFDRGIALTAMLDRRSAACVLAMAGIYRRLLERIDAQPEEAMRRRMSLPTHEKALVAARGMLPLSLPLRGRCVIHLR
jgi:phytoene synthase